MLITHVQLKGMKRPLIRRVAQKVICHVAEGFLGVRCMYQLISIVWSPLGELINAALKIAATLPKK